MQGVDAYNRFAQDDNLGGAISTVGAIGSGLSLVPHPATRYGGAAIGMGAEGLNAFLDYLKNKSIQEDQQPPQQPPEQQQMPVPMAQGGLVGGLNTMYNMPQFGGGLPQPPMQQSPLNTMMPPMAAGGYVGYRKGGLI